MKRYFRSTVIIVLILVMQVNSISLIAAEDNQLMAESFADEIQGVRKMADLKRLFKLLDEIEDVDSFVTSFDSAFNTLFSTGESDLSVGSMATLLYETVGSEKLDDRQAIVDVLLSTSGDESLEDTIGIDYVAFTQGLSQLDELFIMMGNSIIASQLGDDKMIFMASADKSLLTVNESRVTALVNIAANFISIDLDDTENIVTKLKGLAFYYNILSESEKDAFYQYLHYYGFVEGVDPVLRGTPVFKDLDDFTWAVDSIIRLYRNHVINGKSSDAYDPEGAIIRAEFAALIVRLLALSSVDDNVFSDVNLDDWFVKAVNACAASGYVEGVGNGMYDPYSSVSREQVMTVLGRIMIVNGYAELAEAEVDDILSDIPDGDLIDSWARNGVALCIKYGIQVSEESAGDDMVKHVYPDRAASRAEVAEMLNRMDQYIPTVIVSN